MKENSPTLMIRTDLLANGDIHVSTPGAKYPSWVCDRYRWSTDLQAHITAARDYAATIKGVDPTKVLKGTGPGDRAFMYHFAKVRRA